MAEQDPLPGNGVMIQDNGCWLGAMLALLYYMHTKKKIISFSSVNLPFIIGFSQECKTVVGKFAFFPYNMFIVPYSL